MMMEAAPVAALVVAKAELLLEFLIVPLDPPARLGDLDQALERGAPGQVGDPVLGRLGVPRRPLDQQPLFGPGFGALCIAMRRAHPHGREARGQLALSALAPGDGAPVLRRQAERQRLERHRLVFCIAPLPWSGAGGGPTRAAAAAVRYRAPRRWCPRAR